jgi:hypothetical protein
MTNLKTIHTHFALNFMDVRSDEDKARFTPLIHDGLILATETTDNLPLVKAFLKNVLVFDPSYASQIVQQLNSVIANTGDTNLVQLQQQIVENYELTQGPIWGITLETVKKHQR